MPSGFTRRSLARQIAAAALLPAVASPQGRGQAPIPAADQAEVDAQFANVIRKWGDRLSDEQKARVRAAMVRHHRMLMRIREFPIENSDAPATGLRLVPNDSAAPGTELVATSHSPAATEA
jgi:hypothetical protein